MSHISRSVLVSFSAEQMFELVNDVKKYPEFLPGCSDTYVQEATQTTMQASVIVSKAGMKKTFTTYNRLELGRSIAMELIDGPFKHLNGVWRFTPLDEKACKVELTLEFEFSSKMIEIAFGKAFNELTNNMISAFTRRAKQVYQ